MLADGAPDPSFGSGGLTTLDLEGGELFDAAEAADGSIIAAGTAPALGDVMLVVRLRADGTLDPAFGQEGKLMLSVGEHDNASAVRIQADAKIVVAGSTSGAGIAHPVILRLQPDGQFDPTFGNGGMVKLDNGGDESCTRIALRPNGDMVLGVTSYTLQKMCAVSVTHTGQLDASFNGSGWACTGALQEGAWLGGMALGADGSVSLGGFTTSSGHTAFARLSPAGALDTAFEGGSFTYALNPNSTGVDQIWGVALQADGRVVAAGRADQSLLLTRLTTTGKIDATFGKSGVHIDSELIASGAVVVLPDGRILVASGDDHGLTLARYWP